VKYFDAEKLRVRMREQLASQGVVADGCRHVSDALAQASLRGVDSHGINLFPHYSHVVGTGRINREPHFTLPQDAPAAAVLDADHAFGHHAGAHGMQIAMDKAAAVGVGAVNVRNSSHFAAAAYYGLAAAEKGFIGMAFTNADSLVRAHGSAKSYFGTNPVCVTAPLESEGPLCLDMSTSVVSFNRIKNHRLKNQEVDPTWGCDVDGVPCTDPHKVQTLTPTGSYKGFGLGMIVEMLCGVLSGGPYAHQIIPMYTQYSAQRSISHFFIAIDPVRFMPPAQFRARLQEMVNHVRALPALPPAEAVMVPGDPEKRTAVRRAREGIPVEDAKYDEFIALSARFEEALHR
jgi:ureidoglycolate dehydrogenase (NAD+)